MFRTVAQLLALAALSTQVAACDDACLALSKEICRCESTQLAQQACIQRVENEASQAPDGTPTVKQKERCTELIDSCNCDALAAGDLEACGLAYE